MPVEGIAVVEWELGHRVGVDDGDREWDEPEVVDELGEVVRGPQLPDGALDGDLSHRGGADHHPVAGILHLLGQGRRETRIGGKPADEDLCDEEEAHSPAPSKRAMTSSGV